ncbi:winged helix-turn-helix domain-containing protein [Sphingomonas citri]|uniref:LysR family transcriptional regulator n=1 Tax=Sphingomonas citri TaxID=2862499 RepID=A0ABS7BNP8_9SPHN|nr:LysR family transcriptional regulator [Sphingomonas citri]
MRHGPLKLKAQLLCGDSIAFGPGKADLLDAIDAHGSISAAGRALGMSYRRTWLLVDEMNRCWHDRLVATGRGGGGGARLTDDGREVLAAYRALEAAIDVAVESTAAFERLGQRLRDAPLPPGTEPASPRGATPSGRRRKTAPSRVTNVPDDER